MVGLFVCLDLNVMPGSDRASHIPSVMPDLIGHLFFPTPVPGLKHTFGL